MEDWSPKHQLYLALATALAQITGSSYWYYRARELTRLKIHIMTERAKQLQPYKGERNFNVFILKRDKFICYLCGKYIPYGQANCEHDLPLFRWGYTTEANCHAAHDRCNRAKGLMTAAEYRVRKNIL